MLFGQTTEESTGNASDRRRMATLFTSALVIRILYLIESRASNPFFDAPVVDAQSYLELARRIELIIKPLRSRHFVSAVCLSIWTDR